VELVQVTQFGIFKLHKMHLQFVALEVLGYVLESIAQLLMQLELSYLRYLLELAELHC